MSESESSQAPAFEHLTYDLVISLTEDALGQRCTNLCRPLNSYINRVYELEATDGTRRRVVDAGAHAETRWNPKTSRHSNAA